MLGDLSKHYESGNKDSTAIGWDRRGGLSLGKYQIAYKVGTLKQYLIFCDKNYPDISKELRPLYKTIRNLRSSRKGVFANKWIELAKAGKLEDSEHEFIAYTHFDLAFEDIPEMIRILTVSSMAMQQVLWSTAVQHGPRGAVRIFGRIKHTDRELFIKEVYRIRGTRFKKHTAAVQRAVKNRFRDERKQALKMLQEEESYNEEML